MTYSTDFDGRRQSRRPVNIPAWLEGPTGKLVPVMLANLSRDGAQLLINPDLAVPRRFVVRLTQDGKLRRGCRVIWQKAGRIGVRLFHVAAQPELANPNSIDETIALT